MPGNLAMTATDLGTTPVSSVRGESRIMLNTSVEPAETAALRSRTVGLAMSGGGYRATAWGIGAAMAVADLGAVPSAVLSEGEAGTGEAGSSQPVRLLEIAAISSVSGGSIANSWLGLSGDRSAPLDSARLDRAAGTLLPRLVGRPLFWRLGLFLLLVISIVVPWFLREAIPNDALRYLATGGGAVVLATLVGHRSSDLLFGWWAAWVYFGTLIVGLVGVGWIMFLPRGTASRLGLALVALLIVGIFAQFRPYIVQGALARQFRKLAGGGKPRATDLGGHTNHVICITELAGNNLLYAGSGLIYSSNFGLSTDAPLTAAAATQSSANFPGGFPIRWLSRASLGLTSRAGTATAPKNLAVTDGGAYDNMGSHWFAGLDRRRDRITDIFADELPIPTLDVPDLICVANASGLTGISNPVLGTVPIIGELLGLLRVKTVLYEQTTAPRRQELIARFDDQNDPLNGALSHILTSPLAGLERASANDALAVLDGQDPSRDWAAVARRNAAVPTALWPLGDAIVDLVHHAYVLTAVHLHVYNGLPLRLPPRSEFEQLAATGSPRSVTEHWHRGSVVRTANRMGGE